MRAETSERTANGFRSLTAPEFCRGSRIPAAGAGADRRRGLFRRAFSNVRLKIVQEFFPVQQEDRSRQRTDDAGVKSFDGRTMQVISFLEGTKLRKMIAAGFTALFLASGAGAAVAGHGEDNGPGPNGHNDYGLCTAASNGEKNGWKDGALPAPFAGAEDGSDEGDEPGGRQDFIDAFCDPFPTPGGK